MSLDVTGLTLLVALIATMPLFAIRSRGRQLDEDVARRPQSALLGYWLRNWMVWILGPLERATVRAGLSPDFLNYLGLAAGLAAGGAFVAGDLALAGWLIALGGVSDILDGRVARARGVESRYGAFMDSVLDRFAETATFVGIAWLLSGSAWLAAVTVLALAGSLMVSYTRARGEALGVAFAGGLMQRAERVVLLAVGALLDSAAARRLGWPPGAVLSGVVAVIAVGTVGTAIYRTTMIARIMARSDGVDG